jgi:hypothetical protein
MVPQGRRASLGILEKAGALAGLSRGYVLHSSFGDDGDDGGDGGDDGDSC